MLVEVFLDGFAASWMSAGLRVVLLHDLGRVSDTVRVICVACVRSMRNSRRKSPDQVLWMRRNRWICSHTDHASWWEGTLNLRGFEAIFEICL